MNKLIKVGRPIFALGMAGLGIVCFIVKDFIIGRPPAWPKGFEVNPALAYITGTMIIIAALAILLRQKGREASLLIGALILLLSIFRHLPHFMDDWVNAYKSIALFGGTLILAASFIPEQRKRLSGQISNEDRGSGLILAGSICLASFFLAGGYAHFKYVDFVKTLIPDYIPFHVFWSYLAGVCLLAGGLGLLIPQTRRWAALLSGIMVGGWFLLLHIPRFLANPSDPSDRMGLFESFTFAGIFFVLAGMLSKRSN